MTLRTTNRFDKDFDPKAPKARPIPAQGNALGNVPRDDRALKGATHARGEWCRPYRAK